jgi:(p)ppGpp synthase/HD superfamily hydrolase
MSIVENARLIAEKAHQGQFRKWGENEPFINHPLRVADKIASLEGTNEVDIAAAIAHDVLEDCGDHWAFVIAKDCGQEVLDLVKELTFPCEGAEWKHRPRAEKNKIREQQMRQMSPRAKRIKMVDRIDNLNTMQNAPFKLIQKYVVESKTLLDILGYVDEKLAKELESSIEKLKKAVL